MTTEIMQITLSQQPADARWGEKALLSTNDQGITIHLTATGKLGLIQRAARRIDGQGIKKVKLAGKAGTWKTAGRFGRAFAGRKGSVALNGLSCRQRKAKSCNSA